jgi:hypothetical protein
VEITPSDWEVIRRVCRDGFASSFHFAVASQGEDGAPCVTPIGSLVLREPGRAFYLETYAAGLSRRLQRDQRVCVMALDSSRWTLLKALWRGVAREPFGVRLHGTAGERREATPDELALFRRRVRHLRFLRGHGLLWGSHLRTVRELRFDAFEPVRIPPLGDPWPKAGAKASPQPGISASTSSFSSASDSCQPR